jgi:hypothetical protein
VWIAITTRAKITQTMAGAFASASAIPHHRTLGGKRRPDGMPCQGRQPPKVGAEGQPWCARHGPWIGGASPLRSKLEATASRRQLHAGRASRDNPAWRREAVWGRSRRRAAAPNVSEALCRPGRSGERAKERDAQNPTEIGAVLGPGAAVHPVSLPWEVCMGPRRAPHRT